MATFQKEGKGRRWVKAFPSEVWGHLGPEEPPTQVKAGAPCQGSLTCLMKPGVTPLLGSYFCFSLPWGK